MGATANYNINNITTTNKRVWGLGYNITIIIIIITILFYSIITTGTIIITTAISYLIHTVSTYGIQNIPVQTQKLNTCSHDASATPTTSAYRYACMHMHCISVYHTSMHAMRAGGRATRGVEGGIWLV